MDVNTAAYAKSLPKVGVKDLAVGDVINLYRDNWTVAGIEKNGARWTIRLSRVSDGRTESPGATAATRFGLVSRAN